MGIVKEAEAFVVVVVSWWAPYVIVESDGRRRVVSVLVVVVSWMSEVARSRPMTEKRSWSRSTSAFRNTCLAVL